MQQKLKITCFLLLSILFLFNACQDDYSDPGENTDGYFGTRTGVKIRGIVLTDFPATDTLGNSWDNITATDTAGRPDIFYALTDEPDTNEYPAFSQPFQFEDVVRDSVLIDSLTYTITDEYTVRAFGGNIKFDIYDYEKDPVNSNVDSTLMQSFIFSITPGDTTITTIPYPSGIILNQNGYNAIILLDWIKPE